MSDLIGLFNLLAPFFGLIGLGFFCGKVVKQPEAGLAWMQFFLIYVALPCLFYRLIADKPLSDLTNWGFVLATTTATFLAFTLSFGLGYKYTRGNMPQAVMQGVAGSQRPGTIHQRCRGAKVAGLDFRRAERGRREAMEEQEGLPAGRGIDAAHALFDGPDAGHLGESPGRNYQVAVPGRLDLGQDPRGSRLAEEDGRQY